MAKFGVDIKVFMYPFEMLPPVSSGIRIQGCFSSSPQSWQPHAGSALNNDNLGKFYCVKFFRLRSEPFASDFPLRGWDNPTCTQGDSQGVLGKESHVRGCSWQHSCRKDAEVNPHPLVLFPLLHTQCVLCYLCPMFVSPCWPSLGANASQHWPEHVMSSSDVGPRVHESFCP